MISHAFVAQGLEHCSCKPAVESLFFPRAIFIVILVFSPQWNIIPEFHRVYSPQWNNIPEFYCVFSPQWNIIPEFHCVFSPQWNIIPEFHRVFPPQWNIIPEFPRNYILKHLKFIINHDLTCLRSSGVRALFL